MQFKYVFILIIYNLSLMKLQTLFIDLNIYYLEKFRSDVDITSEVPGTDPEIILQVRGVLPSTSTFTVQMYFENRRRSGGGEIKKIKLENGIFCITFIDEKGNLNIRF